jgi:hypothetical protein
MKLWLDDMRKPPFGYDLWAKTADQAIAMLEKHGDRIEHCSLDHDLAEDHYETAAEFSGYGLAPTPIDRSRFKEKTGYAVLEWMHETGRWVADISIHTLNPRGGEDMMSKLKNRAPAHVVYRRVYPRGEA